MNAFDTLEAQLQRSTQRRYGRRWRGMSRLVPIVGVAAALLTIIVIAVARGTANGPAIHPDEQEATSPQPVPAGTWTPVLGDKRRGHPTISRDPVPAEQAAALGVLRRPQTAADRSTAVQDLLRLMGRGGNYGVRVDAVRLLARHGDQTAILVPMERNGDPIAGVPDAKSVRDDALCLMFGNRRSAGGTCGTLADVQGSHLGWPGPPFGLVPDGVASVKLRVRGGRTVTAKVRGNVYDLRTPSNAGLFAIQPPRWFDADGHHISKAKDPDQR